jgi:hypothetical protein
VGNLYVYWIISEEREGGGKGRGMNGWRVWVETGGTGRRVEFSMDGACYIILYCEDELKT